MLRGNLETSVHTMYSHQLTARLTGLASGIKRATLQMYSDLFVDVLSGNDTSLGLLSSSGKSGGSEERDITLHRRAAVGEIWHLVSGGRKKKSFLIICAA